MKERLVRIAHPDLSELENNILSSVSRYQGQDRAIKFEQVAHQWRVSVISLVMDGWIIQLDDGTLLMDETDIMKYGVWREVKDCGCGNP